MSGYSRYLNLSCVNRMWEDRELIILSNMCEESGGGEEGSLVEWRARVWRATMNTDEV